MSLHDDLMPEDVPDDKAYMLTERHAPPKVGMCTACGSVEVALNAATGTRDLSAIGEDAAYPTGYGCEVCA